MIQLNFLALVHFFKDFWDYTLCFENWKEFLKLKKNHNFQKEGEWEGMLFWISWHHFQHLLIISRFNFLPILWILQYPSTPIRVPFTWFNNVTWGHVWLWTKTKQYFHLETWGIYDQSQQKVSCQISLQMKYFDVTIYRFYRKFWKPSRAFTLRKGGFLKCLWCP